MSANVREVKGSNVCASIREAPRADRRQDLRPWIPCIVARADQRFVYILCSTVYPTRYYTGATIEGSLQSGRVSTPVSSPRVLERWSEAHQLARDLPCFRVSQSPARGRTMMSRSSPS